MNQNVLNALRAKAGQPPIQAVVKTTSPESKAAKIAEKLGYTKPMETK